MKKTIAAVISAMFATAAFAQTPAPAAPKTPKPAAVLVNNADLKAPKAVTRAVPVAAPVDAHAAQADAIEAHDDATAAKTHVKDAKMSAKHAKSKTRHVAKMDTVKDKQDTAAIPAPAAPVTQ